jgi:hypothetical protein
LKVPWVARYCCHPAGVEAVPTSTPVLATARVTGTMVTSSNHTLPVLLDDCTKAGPTWPSSGKAQPFPSVGKGSSQIGLMVWGIET